MKVCVGLKIVFFFCFSFGWRGIEIIVICGVWFLICLFYIFYGFGKFINLGFFGFL